MNFWQLHYISITFQKTNQAGRVSTCPWLILYNVPSNSLKMPPGIALPTIRQELKKVVRYPTVPPAVPPTVTDVAGAIKLCHEVYSARRQCHSQPRRWDINAFSRETGCKR